MRTNPALINIIILGIHIFSLNVTNAGKDCEYPSREESYYSPIYMAGDAGICILRRLDIP